MLGIWNFDSCYAASVQQGLKEANRLYQKGRLDEALQRYNEAGVAMPDSPLINFNIGAALYKKEDYQKAQDAFTKALASDDKGLEADALYNIGNCKYRLGKLKENTDLAATAGLLRESLNYYKRAIELDQKNVDARFNHEFVERELKVLLDKLKKQQEEQKEQGDQQQEKEEKEESAQAEGQVQQQEEKEKEGVQEALQEEKETEEKGEPAGRQEAQQEGEERELSEEEARTLLERYGREEASPDYMDKGTRGREGRVLKDW